MKGYRRHNWVIFFILGLLAFGMWGCAAFQPKPTAQLEVIPNETALTPALLKKPVMFKGSGYAPNEMVIVDLMIPKGVKIKSVSEDEESVGVAFANADENGNFQAKMGATATLNWFFQVGWTPNIKPVFKEATPLPPGEYEIRATGAESDKFGLATLTLVPPPKKE
ncbi:MAG: hypothetical protein JSV31_25175 [Desulfobacterales bacterium]|nr:MAG: hypothetical protein JSV31_25175 [Desulfobacterales bacterium]